MKLILLFIAAALPAGLRAADDPVTLPQLQAIGQLPSDKIDSHPENEINPKKKNPFADRLKPKETAPAENVETEESKIRAFFDGINVSGIIRDNGKISVLLGDLTLEEGKAVPPVIPGQTQKLRVGKITEKDVQMLWVEGEGFENSIARQYRKAIQLAPRIAVALPGTTSVGEGAGVTYLDESLKVVWPKLIVRDPAAYVGTLPPGSNPESLTPEEEVGLLQLANPGAGAEAASALLDALTGNSAAEAPTGEEDPVIQEPTVDADGEQFSPPAEGASENP